MIAPGCHHGGGSGPNRFGTGWLGSTSQTRTAIMTTTDKNIRTSLGTGSPESIMKSGTVGTIGSRLNLAYPVNALTHNM